MPTVMVRVWEDATDYEDRPFLAEFGDDENGQFGLLPTSNDAYTFRAQTGTGPRWHAWRIRL